MYYLLFCVFAFSSSCHCLFGKDEKNENSCGLLKELLETASVSLEINKNGFHRDVVTTIELSPEALGGFRVLLVQRWPSGVYIDPYQIAALSDKSDWQILLDSAIDLELPAHKTSGFVSYVYPTSNGSTPRLLKVTIPIHGRYHKPSFDGETFTFVNIEPPELLLWSEKCMKLNIVEPLTVIDAPCTPDNSSTCTWVKHQHQQGQGSVGLRLPVCDGSLATPICGGTLLVTMICCVALSKYMWEHRVI